MRARTIAALLVAMSLGACSSQSDQPAPLLIDSGTSTLMAAARLTCTPPQIRKGNRCVAPTPVPTQTCWDGSVIPTTQQCPVKPPPPPPPVQCPDGTTVPAGQTCPVPPPPPPPATQTCPDGTVILATDQCPVPPPPATQVCPDGTVILATATCPIVAPPPVPAPGPAVKFTLGSYVTHCSPAPDSAIFKVTGVAVTSDADPALRLLVYELVFVSDPKGNFPAGNAYWTTYTFRLNEPDLCASSPPATPLISGERA